MTDIRPIRADEGEAFLTLLCEVFELDYDRAEGVFFSEPLFDLQHKWGLFQGRDLVSILTTVPLHFGWGDAVGIAGVCTRESLRGEGLASQLIERVLHAQAKQGCHAAFLFAQRENLYGGLGFRTVDHVIRGRVLSNFEDPDLLPLDDVMARYDGWAASGENRLRRDDRRWQYWKWHLRIASPLGGGYLCTEGNVLREAICDVSLPSWPVPPDTEWFGLASMAALQRVPLVGSDNELLLMARGTDRPPEMFMTDQF